jgi:hypothetical protein
MLKYVMLAPCVRSWFTCTLACMCALFAGSAGVFSDVPSQLVSHLSIFYDYSSNVVWAMSLLIIDLIDP